MSSNSKLEEIKKYYWACGKCMEEAGGIWPEGHCATATQDTCKICGAKDKLLSPWVDYNWPNNAQLNKIAKVSRD